MASHIAAIHTLKSKLQLSEGDYRALIVNLTGKSSSKDMTPTEQQQVREHMQRLAERMGLTQPTRRRPLSQQDFDKVRQQASPKERKLWALWHQLGRDGLVQNTSAQALNAWINRQAGVSALRFCSSAQLDTLIEAAKAWQERK